jgi:hypothetical protein
MERIKFYNHSQGLLHPPLDLFFIYKLEERGYQVMKVRSVNKSDDTLYFLTFPSIEHLPKNYIVYNFEYNITDEYRKILEGAKEVWDYSTYNITKLNILQHIFVPFIPTLYKNIREKMQEYVKEREKNIEFLFYGCKNDRRESILKSINKKIEIYGHSWDKAVYNEDLFLLLGRTRYVINLHFYKENIMEIYRLFECHLLSTTVITEKGFIDDVYLPHLPHLIIVDDILNYINHL